MTRHDGHDGHGPVPSPPGRAEAREIWVLAEHLEGCVSEATVEAWAFAVRLAAAVAARVTVVTLGGSAPELARSIARRSGLAVLGVRTPGAPEPHTEISRRALQHLASLLGPPAFLLAPHTAAGWDLAPALAVDLGACCITGVTGLHLDNGPVFSRTTFHGKLVEDLRPPRGVPAVITLAPGTESAEWALPDRTGHVRLYEIPDPPGGAATRWIGRTSPDHEAARLRNAEVVVAAGRGVGAPEHLEPLRALARLFPRSALGASRPLCDMGWLPYDHQVGMTGQTVSPRLYIACGVSGAVQHTQGIRRADLVVSINIDPQAPFCASAHCCVVEDLHTFLPVLIEAVRAHRRTSS